MDPLNLFLGFTNVCRLCLSQDRPLIKIFPESVQEKGVLFSIASKILACVGIQVQVDDNLPEKICEMCLKEIDNWTQFKQICDNANTLLLQSVAGLSPLQNQILQNNLRGCHEENLENLITPSVFDERLALEAESFFQKIDEKHLPSLLSADSLSSVFIDSDNIDQNETITLYSGETENSEMLTQICSKKVIGGSETLDDSMINLELKEGLIVKEPEVCMEDIMVVTEPDVPEINMEDIIVELEHPALFESIRSPSKGPMSVDIKADRLQESDINFEILNKPVENLPVSLLDRHKSAVQNRSEEGSEINKQNTDLLIDENGFLQNVTSDELFEGTKENREGNLKQSTENQREKYLERYHKYYKRKYDCGFCPKLFSKFINLLKHDKIEHADAIAKDKCGICGTCFISEGRLLFHSFFRHREKKYQCVHCNFTSVCKKSLTHHIQHTHIKEYTLPPCHICGRRYRSKSNLVNHIRLHESTKHPCHICGSEFSQSQSLNRHFEACHSEQNSFECDICFKQFKMQSYLKLHTKNHHSTNPSVCDICGHYYKNENTLNIHKKTHEQRTHCCNICNKLFTTKNLLNRHMNIHNSSHIYICEVCDKVFNRNDVLKEHLLTHADVQKPFKCENCNETFRLKRYLRAHSKNMHKNER